VGDYFQIKNHWCKDFYLIPINGTRVTGHITNAEDKGTLKDQHIIKYYCMNGRYTAGPLWTVQQTEILHPGLE
jgi:hypothetical protein